jgi:hypothetical protein
VKLVANIQLTPTKANAKLLRDTLERCNAASNVASEVGFERFPRYTSQGCPECGFVHKGNRPCQDRFARKECGYEAPADFVGARNLRMRGIKTLGAKLVMGAPETLRAGTTERDAPHWEAGAKAPPFMAGM